MIAPDLNEFISKPSTQAFLGAAKRFVDVIESKDLGLEQFMRDLHVALVDLYATGYHLDEVPLKYSNENTDFDRKALFKDMNARRIQDLGEEAFYWHVYDPTYSKEPDPSQGFLTDDVYDIYHDLKIELATMDIGTSEAVEHALWTLKWSHQHHWGEHCINALQYLHNYCYDGKQVI